MNDVNFCYKLYDDIMKIYSDTSAYRVTTYEDNKAQIEYIPECLAKCSDKAVSKYINSKRK